MRHDDLRLRMVWNKDYRREWDRVPDAYLENGLVGWAGSRRLGMLREGSAKAYIGVQHVDPARAGWGSLDAPQTRFFLSTFIGTKCVALRVFPTVDDALDYLSEFLTP